MKAYLQFNLPEETEEFNLANDSGKLAVALFEIRNDLFRPARKHGYDEGPIKDYLDSFDEKTKDRMIELILLLEEKFSSICEQNGVLEHT